MNCELPVPLKQEYEALHDQLRQATQAGGEVESTQAGGRANMKPFQRELRT